MRAKLPPVPQPGKAYVTDEEYAERTRFCYEMVRDQKPKGEIKTAFRARFTPIVEANAKTIEKHITEAKLLLVADVADGKDVMRAQSYATYLKVLTGSADDKDKIAAQARIDKLFGLEAPTKIAPTTPDGEKSYEQLTDAELDARILAAASARTED